MFITGAHEVSSSSFVSFSGATELELSGIGLLGKFGCTLLSFVEVVVSGLDASILVAVLSRLQAVKILCTPDLFLIARSLFLQLGQFITGIVDFLVESMTAISLLSNVTLGGKDFGFTARDLLTGGGNLSLEVVVRAALLVEQETSIVDLFLKAAEGHEVRVRASLEVVVLEKLLILQVSELGLDGVKLIAKRKVVLVALLDLEDLSLELGNEEVLLVGSQMHAVVVLSKVGNG